MLKRHLQGITVCLVTLFSTQDSYAVSVEDALKVIDFFTPSANERGFTDPGIISAATSTQFRLDFTGGAVDKTGSFTYNFRTDPAVWQGSLAFSQEDTSVQGGVFHDTLR